MKSVPQNMSESFRTRVVVAVVKFRSEPYVTLSETIIGQERSPFRKEVVCPKESLRNGHVGWLEVLEQTVNFGLLDGS